jgi:hypothetical protein
VFSIDDSTEAVLQRKIESMQRLIREDPEQAIHISSIAKRHYQLQIETLQNAPRDAAKLEQIIKAKERENKEARHIYETERSVTEIEMLKFMLYLVMRGGIMKRRATGYLEGRYMLQGKKKKEGKFSLCADGSISGVTVSSNSC